eukprot:192959-Hanusia_phi.AAC.1
MNTDGLESTCSPRSTNLCQSLYGPTVHRASAATAAPAVTVTVSDKPGLYGWVMVTSETRPTQWGVNH